MWQNEANFSCQYLKDTFIHIFTCQLLEVKQKYVYTYNSKLAKHPLTGISMSWLYKQQLWLIIKFSYCIILIFHTFTPKPPYT